jgi:hypothetical protein
LSISFSNLSIKLDVSDGKEASIEALFSLIPSNLSFRWTISFAGETAVPLDM